MKKLQRFLTALMTLLFIAPSYSAMAADVPTSLKIKGWTVNDKDWTGIESTSYSDSKFYFNVTLTNGKIFKFEDQNGTEYGPGGESGGAADKTISCNVPENLLEGSAAYVLNSDGTEFKITVDFSGPAPLMQVAPASEGYPEIKQPEPAEFPGELYLIGNVADGNGWGNVGFNIQGKRNEENRTFTFIEARINGSFAFCNDVTTNADGCKSHDGFYGPSGSDAPANIGANNTMVNKSGHGYTIDSGYYDVVAHFPESGAPYFTITKVEGIEDWYFVGDLNNWFSKEFTEEGGGQSFVGENSLWATTKHNWKFKRVTADINAELAGKGARD